MALWLYLYRGKLLSETSSIFEIKSDVENVHTENTTRRDMPEEIAEKSGSQIISTCSVKSDGRGFGQKVIGFSIYGSLADPGIFARYVTPLKSVVDRIKDVYASKNQYVSFTSSL